MKTKSGLLCLLALLAAPAVADPTKGEGVFNQWCIACHTESPFAPGTIALSARLGSELGAIRNNPGLQRDYIAHLVRNGQGSMPNFRRPEITNDEQDALLAYFDTLKEAKQ